MRKTFFEVSKKFLVKCLCLLIVTILFSFIQPKVAKAQSIQIELMASTSSWEAKEVGHAFLCISIPLGSGIKEDCYGFYPLDSGIGRIYGQGLVASEPTHEHIGRFSRITVSFKRPISDEQRRQIIKMIDAWNSQSYHLTAQSCIDFVNSIAQFLRWVTPPRVATDSPETYLKKLVDANELSVKMVTMTPERITLDINASQQLTPTLKDANAQTLNLDTHVITYSSSAPNVATVDKTGLIHAVSAGSAVITGVSEGVSGTVNVSVVDPNPPGWYGFAGVLADRDNELRQSVGNFRRLNVGGDFNSLCAAIKRTCQRVIDWNGASQPCTSGRDGTRLAFCQ